MSHTRKQPWDSHASHAAEQHDLARQSDGPIAASLTDLHSRCLLDETLVD